MLTTSLYVQQATGFYAEISKRMKSNIFEIFVNPGKLVPTDIHESTVAR